MAGDQTLMRRWLETVGYYRLSAYWLPFELPAAQDQTRTKKFQSDAMFETIVDIYVFDRKLRLLVMEGIERIEIALRSRWTNRLALAHGSCPSGCRGFPVRLRPYLPYVIAGEPGERQQRGICRTLSAEICGTLHAAVVGCYGTHDLR